MKLLLAFFITSVFSIFSCGQSVEEKQIREEASSSEQTTSQKTSAINSLQRFDSSAEEVKVVQMKSDKNVQSTEMNDQFDEILFLAQDDIFTGTTLSLAHSSDGFKPKRKCEDWGKRVQITITKHFDGKDIDKKAKKTTEDSLRFKSVKQKRWKHRKK